MIEALIYRLVRRIPQPIQIVLLVLMVIVFLLLAAYLLGLHNYTIFVK